jgi:hypothetical protein
MKLASFLAQFFLHTSFHLILKYGVRRLGHVLGIFWSKTSLEIEQLCPFLEMSYFDWPMTPTKSETLEAPQTIGFYWKMECLPFGPPI